MQEKQIHFKGRGIEKLLKEHLACAAVDMALTAVLEGSTRAICFASGSSDIPGDTSRTSVKAKAMCGRRKRFRLVRTFLINSSCLLAA
jgi:hypothetical protein